MEGERVAARSVVAVKRGNALMQQKPQPAEPSLRITGVLLHRRKVW